MGVSNFQWYDGKIDGLFGPDPGNTLLLVNVLIGNLSDQPQPYNPLYFKVKSTAGHEFNTFITEPKPSLKSGELEPGDKVQGWIAFELPKNEPGPYMLTYQPLVIFGGYVPLRVQIK